MRRSKKGITGTVQTGWDAGVKKKADVVFVDFKIDAELSEEYGAPRLVRVKYVFLCRFRRL